MKIQVFINELKMLNIQMITGVPDSTLKVFCEYMRNANDIFDHVVAANEGAAVGMAIGEYLATGRPACVYMQNSGLGNVVNPVTSLTHKDVYQIPVLFIIGWRGEPGLVDEPQHKYMGNITIPLLDNLDIDWSIVESNTTESDLHNIFEKARNVLKHNNSFALIVKKGTFEEYPIEKYNNNYGLIRENVIKSIVEWLDKTDVVVSTTGKISRELYEQSELVIGNHNQSFLTVGGMGHADMIAYQIARRSPKQRVICLDGDGALLMHMGSMAVIGNHPEHNMVHICLNNEVHESVGSIPTAASGMCFSNVARAVGYSYVASVHTHHELSEVLNYVRDNEQLSFIEVFVSTKSRADLGRPKESAIQNKEQFMRYHGVIG